ncbi:hypothetical protein V7S43_011216 [Phytophthora oleae]|uniref:PiggyBac transposable element-derived protein 4 C-terminal zinc-ribbon domain-containing protein n=1 Tax=Phytophthora oleae TaxID=2107226 RepID=A0ABD3FAJ5_9STRA
MLRHTWCARSNGGATKRRSPSGAAKACKVCAILHTGKRAPTSKFFCGDYNGSGTIFLCKAARYKVRDVAMTCWDIWHREWVNGNLMPVDTGRTIRIRRAAEAPPGTPSTPGTPATPGTSAPRTKRRRTTT